MNMSQHKNHNDFRSSIFNHFLCCMFCCCFSLPLLVLFLLHLYEKVGKKSHFFSYFVFSFDHSSQKTPTHLMMYQYSDSNLEWFFFIFSVRVWIVFFYILSYRCVREYHKKILGKFINFWYFASTFDRQKWKISLIFITDSTCVHWIWLKPNHKSTFHLETSQ